MISFAIPFSLIGGQVEALAPERLMECRCTLKTEPNGVTGNVLGYVAAQPLFV